MTTHDPMDVFSRTLWGEAHGTGAAGMRHVASVVLNRVLYRQWGDSIVDVCLAPGQFHCWNDGSRSLAQVKSVTIADPWFLIAMGIARAAIDGKLKDETSGADSYYALSVKEPPPWTKHARHTYSDGWHSFWRIESSVIPKAQTISLHSIDTPGVVF